MSEEKSVLSQTQLAEYYRVGAIVVPDILSEDDLLRLRRVTDGFVEKARGVTQHDNIYDLEDSHTPSMPRVRRIKTPHLHDPEYGRLVHNERIVAVLKDLWGPNIRFDTSKLNLKSPGFGAPVEWHQDWAFYPHTNDDLAAVGVMIDDMDLENGPLMIIPGTHKGPIFDHHYEGKFCGAMDPARMEIDYSRAIPLTGKAGSITVHHVRTVHGSAPNMSGRERRLLLLQFRAADAYPLVNTPKDIASYDKLMVAGTPLEPRLTAVPVRMPLPPADFQGSIYENQRPMVNRFFETPESVRRPNPATAL